MLWAHEAEYHEDWDLHLPILEMQFNNTKNATTGLTPFEVVYGFNISTPMDIFSGSLSSGGEAELFLSKINKNVEVAKMAIEKMQEQQKDQADQHQLRKCGKKQISEYLVKWLGYPMYQATWEPYNNMADTQALEDYEVGEKM